MKVKKSAMRMLVEAAAWIGLIVLLWGSDLLVKLAEREQAGFGKETFKLVSEQVTSGIAVLVMVLFLVQWLKLFPLKLSEWPRSVIGHTVGSIIFAFGHFSLMVALRIPWYALHDRDYLWREPFVANLIVEYQKDIKIYIGFVIVLAAYQRFRNSQVPAAASNRLRVQTGSGDAVLQFEQVDYLEAARNYIAVHAGGREYVIRKTMANVIQSLPADRFVRTHRSYIVNVDKVSEIRTIDSSQRVFLTTGADVPLSRSYRDEFNRRIAGIR